MTSAWRGRARRSNGSIVTRSVVSSWRSPPWSIGPVRATSVSNASDQSSSVPSSSPIRCARAMGGPLPPGAGEQIDQVRVERVAPGGEVVRVAHDVKRGRVALAAQGGRDRPVVDEVLLGRAAGQRDGDRGGGRPGVQHAPDEAADAAEAGEAGPVAVPPAAGGRARTQGGGAARPR